MIKVNSKKQNKKKHCFNSFSDDRQYINLLRILQDLYRLGFRVISQEVNMIVGADKNGIYNFLEIVFMKET